MKRVTRRQIHSWLAPMRRCLAELRTGEVDSIRGYAVTHLDDYSFARIDFCIAGFRALIVRLCPQVGTCVLAMIEKKIAAGLPLTVAEIDAAFAAIHKCEAALIKCTVAQIQSAKLTEEIAIELDVLKTAD